MVVQLKRKKRKGLASKVFVYALVCGRRKRKAFIISFLRSISLSRKLLRCHMWFICGRSCLQIKWKFSFKKNVLFILGSSRVRKNSYHYFTKRFYVHLVVALIDTSYFFLAHHVGYFNVLETVLERLKYINHSLLSLK